MAEYYTSDLKKELQKYAECVEKDLKEIRKAKAEIQRMKMEVESMVSGQYIRDDKRIVLSAPEIIIGNVDYDGMLKGDSPYSHVIIRSNDIEIEGASPTGSTAGGSITQRASVISTIAVDPGADGLESVVGERSAIIQQARSISLNTNDAKDAFTSGPALPVSGIALNSDTRVSINATPSNEGQTKDVENAKSGLESAKSALKSAVASKKSEVERLLDNMEQCLKNQEGLTDDEFTTAMNLTDIYDQGKELELLKGAMGPAVAEYVGLVSRLAEVNRQSKAMDAAKQRLSSAKGNFLTQSCGGNVSINGETISLLSIDGDGNLRTNPGAAINMQAQSVNVTSTDKKGALMKDGVMSVNAKVINISTADTAVKDEKNWENPAVGDLNIVSKNINVGAVDMETKEKKPALKEQTKGGKLSVRVETVDVLAADKEGKANGAVSINAKAVEIKSMDVDKEKGTDKQLAAGSTMVLLSEKMWEGSKDSKNKSKQVQIASEKVAVIAKTTAEVQQEKAIVQLDGGNMSVAGGKMALYGETTINGKTDIKGDVKAPKATIDNIEAKSSFKSTNISDGIAVPGAPASATLSAKMKEEDAPKKG